MKKGVRNYYLIFSLIEIIIFMIFSFKNVTEKELLFQFGSGDFFCAWQKGQLSGNELIRGEGLKTKEVFLKKGIYDIEIFYSASGTGKINVIGGEGRPGSLWAEEVSISNMNTYKAFQVWVNDPEKAFCVQVSSDDGTLVVNEIQIKTACNSKFYRGVCFLLKLVLLNGFVAIYSYRKKLKKYSVVFVGIGGITLVASLGVLTRYMLPGHDLVFHLLRIEGLKDGLLSGSFPVRIQPNWCNGWGYAVSILYSDIMLLLPALMRMAGFTVQISYKVFVILVNLITVFFSFYCFWKICQNKGIALLGSMLYVLSPYRLCCIYIRGALGEYTAMIFLPFIVLGLWHVLYEKNWKKYWALVIGFSGLLQTHVLSCQMVAVFLVLLCLIIRKIIFNIKIFMCLLKAVAIALVINLWFLVPFIRYMREDLQCTAFKEMAYDYQMLGVSITELLAQEPSGYYGYSWSELISLGNKFSIPLGNGLLLCAISALLLLWNDKLEEKKATALILFLGMISTWMATNLFPYQQLGKMLPHFAAFLAKPGLPYRYLSISCILFSMLAVILFWKVRDRVEKKIVVAFFCVVAVIALDQGVSFIYQTIYSGYYELHYDGSLLDTTNLMGNEYLYAGSETWLTEAEYEPKGQNVSILESHKEYNRMEIKCQAGTGEAYLEAPLFYYPGYTAYDRNNEKVFFKIMRGSNNRIKVLLPDRYEGTICIRFIEPFSWRIGESISLIGMASILFIKLKKLIQNKCKGILVREE